MVIKPAAERLVRALGAPDEWDGLALAVRNALRYMKAQAMRIKDPVISAWVEQANDLRGLLDTAAEEESSLITFSADLKRRRGFGVFLETVRSTHDPDTTLVLEAEFGSVIIKSAIAGVEVPPALSLGFATLLRSGDPRQRRNPEWATLAASFPATAKDLQARIASTEDLTIQRFLVGVSEVHAIAMVGPAELGTTTAGPREAGSGPVELKDPAPDDGSGEQGDPDGERVPLEPQSNFIVWLIKRSMRSGFRAHFGVLMQWDYQTLEELQVICGEIAREIKTRGPHLAEALFAVMCLVSSLPGDMALFVPMTKDTDLWNDWFRSLKWNLLRVLDSEAALAMSPDDLPSEWVVEIPFPGFVTEAAALFAARHPHAQNVVELLTGSNKIEDAQRFLEGYRAWLRGLGKGWLHAVYDARFAGSLWQVYRAYTGDVATGLLSLNFDELALAMLHYIRLRRSFLLGKVSVVYAHLNWGEPSGYTEVSSHVGRGIAQELEVFSAKVLELRARAAEARKRMISATAQPDLLAAQKDLVHLRALEIITLAGGRGNHLERMTWSMLFGCALYVLLRDKDVDDYSEVRGVPVYGQLAAALDAHVQDLDHFVEQAARLGLPAKSHQGRGFDDRLGDQACFVFYVLKSRGGDEVLAREPLSRETLTSIAEDLFVAELNVGRHTLINSCIEFDVDSWLNKAFSGHHRGHAEPFSDGGAVSPECALGQLRSALEWITLPMGSPDLKPEDRFVLPLSALVSQLPSPKPVEARAPDSRARVLPPPWSIYTPAALRVEAYLRGRLLAGQWPEEAGAALLLVLRVVNWIPMADLEAIWSQPGSLQEVASGAPLALWSRHGSVAEIHRPLEAPAAIALLKLQAGGSVTLPDWGLTCAQAEAWVKRELPNAKWPEDHGAVLACIDALMDLQLRILVTPFCLAAASPALKSATVNRRSVYRLALSPDHHGAVDDVLLLPAPVIRGPRAKQPSPSPLATLINRVHHWGKDEARLGEDFARWKGLSEEATDMDLEDDARAIAIRVWIEDRAAPWKAGVRGPLQVSSASAYLRRIEKGLFCISPAEPLKKWSEEWLEWAEDVLSTAKGEEKTEALQTALRSFFRALAGGGYSIPEELLDAAVERGAGDGMRRAASATLLLQADRERIDRLMVARFAEIPLYRELAEIYSKLRWEASLRAVEPAVLPLNGVSLFFYLVITSDGFSHLKSEHARRLQVLSAALAMKFHEVAALVRAAEPGSKWLFLFDKDDDWTVVNELSSSFSAAIKQSVGEPDARPHASRPVAPLEELLPGWEPMMRALTTGTATTAQCIQFCRALADRGVSALIEVILRVGHGHPITFVKYYFAIWPLLLSVFARASLARHADPLELLKRQISPKAANAFVQARRRAAKDGLAFDPWGWALNYAASRLKLQSLSVTDEVTPPTKPVKRAATAAGDRSEEEQVRYLALRLTGLGATSAAHVCGLTNSLAASLEDLLGRVNVDALRRRMQSSPTGRGQKAELGYLRDESGTLLISRLMCMPTETLDEFGRALVSERAARMLVRPSVSTLPRLLVYLAHLPVDLGLIVQFGEGRCSVEEQARINQHSPRLHVGKPIPGLGPVPRISVVEAEDNDNTVTRARLTSSTRCVIAAIQLIRA
jgi:hypothetical protein